MKRMERVRRMFAGLVCLVMLCCLALPGLAEEAQTTRRTVRIAFPSQSGMSGVGASGNLEGYNYEYLQELAEYAGWNLQFITFEDLSANDGIMNAMQQILTGEADLLGPMLKSDAVEQMFDFPQDNYGVVYTTLCALEKSTITSVNFAKLSPLRVAVYSTAETRNREVCSYLDQLGVTYELVMCDTADEQLSALQYGRADVLSSITLSYFDGTRSVAQFAPRPYYFVTTKGNTDLLAELDAATQALNYTRPHLQQQLQEKYFGATSSGYVLTDDEQLFMNGLQTLDVLCASPSDAPYVMQDAEGKPAGLLVSLLDDFAALNKLNVHYTLCASPAEAEEKWETGDFDCLIGAPFSSKYCAANGLVRTEPITTVDLVLFARQETETPLDQSTVAIYNRLADQVNTERYAKVLLLDDPLQCYDAVESGQADYGCSDRLITEYTLFERDSALVTLPLMGEQEEICIAVSSSMNVAFISALNKFIHTLPDSTKTTYISEGSRHAARTGLLALVKNHPIPAALILSSIVILLIGVVMFAFYATRIRHKNRELLKANAAKSEFLARMSHDIRTPMNAIVGYLAIARDTEGCPERVSHCIDNSDIAAKHLLQLINDVLDMSSIESGKMKIAQEEFDLKREIADASAIFYQTGKAKGVRFTCQVKGLTEEWVVGDQLRMNQIIMNLLSNAVKFTPAGGRVCLTVEQERADENGSDLVVTVSDTGIGMSKEYISRLFQPFEQESAATARQYGGSGLGLSIVHNLVEMMGGTIEVDSRQGEGTTFTLRIRMGRAVKHDAALAVLPDGARVRALLISENETEGAYAQAMLEGIGVKSDVVSGAAYAVKRIHRRSSGDYPYSLCLLDWNSVSEEQGDLAALKAEADAAHLTLVAAGYDMTAFEEQARASGITLFAQKPLFRSTLSEMVGRVLNGQPAVDRERKSLVSANLKGARVLLAEDNAMNLEIATTVLGKAGVQVTPAEDGRKALELFEARPVGSFDFILMDVQMPEMNGYEATRAIRALPRPDAATIPIIAMTANAFAEDVQEALKNGMNAHIAKPVNYDKLFAVLEELGKR